MTVLGRLERAFAEIVDGSVARAFRLRVQPAEIGRQLERAMLDGRMTSVGVTLAPNHYNVRLHPGDAASFADWSDALGREMEMWLAELAYARGVATIGRLQVTIEADESVRRGLVRVTSRFDGDVQGRGSDLVGEPRVLRLLPAGDRNRAEIRVAAGARIGRAEDNEVVIPHPEVSRYHARIELDGTAWRVVDLQSTNGTWVNGGRILVSVVHPGDVLDFGSARFTVASDASE